MSVAGRLFAARGIDGVTAKEICKAADAVPAAVNYHFGGLAGLYEAVLIEVRDQATGSDQRLDLLQAIATPEEKLRSLIAFAVKAVLDPAERSWTLQLVAREMTHPTPAGRRILGPVIRPRLNALRAFISETVALEPDDPRIDLALISIAAPLHSMLIRDRSLLLDYHPTLELHPKNEAMLVDYFQGNALAVLEQVTGLPSLAS